MLGSEVAACMTASGCEYTGSDRDVDISSTDAISSFAHGKYFQWIVNCAAYTAVDKAEAEPEKRNGSTSLVRETLVCLLVPLERG